MAMDSQDHQVPLAGRTLTLRYSLKAMLALKDRWQLENLAAVEARLARSREDVEDFAAIMWAGLRTHHPDISEADVLDMLDDAGASGMEKVQDALEAATPPPRPPGKGQRTPASR